MDRGSPLIVGTELVEEGQQPFGHGHDPISVASLRQHLEQRGFGIGSDAERPCSGPLARLAEDHLGCRERPLGYGT